MRKTSILVLALAGCGLPLPGENSAPGVTAADSGSPPTNPNNVGVSQLDLYQSGTRIRAKVGTTPDGSKQFMGWFDKTLNADCAFLPSVDGKNRCLPVVVDSSYVEVWSDAACAVRILGLNAAAGCPFVPPSRAMLYQLAPTCPAAYLASLWTVGSEVAGGLTLYSKATGSCAVQARLTGYRYFAATPVDLTQFVEMTVTTE